MKKLLALLLASLLLCCCALGETAEEYAGDPEAEENAFLTKEEIDMYLTALAGDALALGVESSATSEDSGVTTVKFAGGAEVYIADEELTETSAVLGARLNAMQEDLRGIHLGDTLEDVLSVYPNDNPNLAGSRFDAALYVNDQRPEATVGYLLRLGQPVTEVTHLVFSWEDEGVVRCGVTYQFEQDIVTGISIFGLGSLVPEADALEEISNVAQIQEIRDFTPFPTSLQGESLNPFEESDLAFNGLDFLQLTNESAESALGEAPVDEWMEDGEGFLRVRQWDEASVIFVYDAQKNFVGVDTLTVVSENIEGPRGVHVGDGMESVMNRFHRGEIMPLENGFALYGDGENAPYGVLSYGETTATLTYALTTKTMKTVIWSLEFVNGTLESYRLLLR